jgi:hypothetical protein
MLELIPHYDDNGLILFYEMFIDDNAIEWLAAWVNVPIIAKHWDGDDAEYNASEYFDEAGKVLANM